MPQYQSSGSFQACKKLIDSEMHSGAEDLLHKRHTIELTIFLIFLFTLISMILCNNIFKKKNKMQGQYVMFISECQFSMFIVSLQLALK